MLLIIDIEEYEDMKPHSPLKLSKTDLGKNIICKQLITVVSGERFTLYGSLYTYMYFTIVVCNTVYIIYINILNCKLNLDLQNVCLSFRPSIHPSVLPSVPLNLLEFLSNSFNIAHMTSLQYCEGS